MKFSKYGMSKQRGFSIITGFLVSVVLFGAIAFFLAGKGINSGLGASYSLRSTVSGMLTSAGYIATGYNTVLFNNTLPANVTFDTAATTGVFNPTSGGATPQSLDPSLFLAAPTAIQGYWVYRNNGITLNTVGVPATADFTMLTSGLKLSVCQQINNTLHGTAIGAAPTVLTAITEALLVGAPTAAVPVSAVATDLSALGTPRRMNGCYATSDGTAVYVYIHTLLAQ